MRILHLYKDYAPVVGGIENHVRVLAERQARDGHDVSVLTFAAGIRPETVREHGVRVIRSSRLVTAASMPLGVDFPLRLARERPDVVHLHAPFPLGAVANLGLGRGRATVITYHSDIIRQAGLLRLYAPLLRRALVSADRIITTSAVYRDSSPWLRPVRSTCRVVPLGIDTERFAPAEAPGAPRDLLFVGKFRHYKGLDVLLHTAERPDCRMTLAGDGPGLEHVRAEVARRGLADRVRLPGFVPDHLLPDLYRDHGIFVLPASSRAEAFGTVLLEAMATALPVITTEVGSGSTWVVRHEETGLVVPPNDPAAFASAVTRLREDAAAAARMGRKGRARCEQLFSEDAMLSGVEAVYREALAGGTEDQEAG